MFQRQFGFVVTVSVQMVVGNAQLLADEFGDSLEGGRLGNFDVASHDATLGMYKTPSLRQPPVSENAT